MERCGTLWNTVERCAARTACSLLGVEPPPTACRSLLLVFALMFCVSSRLTATGGASFAIHLVEAAYMATLVAVFGLFIFQPS